MKKLLIIMLAIIMLSMCACSDSTVEANVPSVEELMKEFPSRVDNEHKIVDVDINTLDNFCETINTMKVRLRGMITEYKREPNLFNPSLIMTSCKLVCGDKVVSVSFESENEQAKDGEYVEIVGELKIKDYVSIYKQDIYFDIDNAEIIDRGSAVKAQCEVEE